MKVTVVGSGYVGLVSGACLADIGNHVCCLDVDEEKIRILQQRGVPIYEPGLQEMIATNVKAGRLFFTTNVAEAVAFASVQFIAVGTPPGEDGSEVASDVYNTNRTEDIEVFIEVILKLNKKDAREYFQKTNQIENCHINSIALVSGIKKEIAAGQFDYSDARMITKLNFGNEMLENKEITFRYRIYTN